MHVITETIATYIFSAGSGKQNWLQNFILQVKNGKKKTFINASLIREITANPKIHSS